MQSNKKNLIVGCGIVSILVAFAYWPVLGNGFVWDDKLFLFNPEYADSASWWKILTSPFDVSVNYFRPLVLASFIVELSLVGLNPFSFHLTNLSLHLANTLLVILLAQHVVALRRDTSPAKAVFIALCAGTFYGIHPATVEATAWISGRFDLMLTLFSLLLLYIDAKVSGLAVRLAIVSICFLCAALSKEMAAAMGIVLPLWHLATRRHDLKSFKTYFGSIRASGDLYVYLAIIGAGLIYLIVRFAALGYLYVPDSPLDIGSPLQRVLLVGKSIGWYALLVLMPFITLSPIHYQAFPLSAADPLAWVALFAITWIGMRIVLALKRGSAQAWYWLAAFCSMLPVINIIPLTIGDSIVHERFLQYPLTMFAIAGAASLAGMRAWEERGRQLVYGGVAVAVLGLCVINVRVTASVWRDNLTLWYWTALKSPDSAIAVGNLASAYRDRGEAELSLGYALRAVRLSPSANSWIIAGTSLSDLGLFVQAERFLRAGVVLKPKNAFALNNLGSVLMKLERFEEAESILLDGLAIAPLHRMLNRNLAILYLNTEREELALAHFRKAYVNLPYDEMEKDLVAQTEKIAAAKSKLSTSVRNKQPL